jgi:hypothetical protein
MMGARASRAPATKSTALRTTSTPMFTARAPNTTVWKDTCRNRCAHRKMADDIAPIREYLAAVYPAAAQRLGHLPSKELHQLFESLDYYYSYSPETRAAVQPQCGPLATCRPYLTCLVAHTTMRAAMRLWRRAD